MGELGQLPNIGKTLGAQLQAAGVETPAQLRALGSREAWLRLLGRDAGACCNSLYALEGAVQNIRWHNLPQPTKDSLRSFFQQAKSGVAR